MTLIVRDEKEETGSLMEAIESSKPYEIVRSIMNSLLEETLDKQLEGIENKSNSPMMFEQEALKIQQDKVRERLYIIKWFKCGEIQH